MTYELNGFNGFNDLNLGLELYSAILTAVGGCLYSLS
jgi:hypothetical protein